MVIVRFQLPAEHNDKHDQIYTRWHEGINVIQNKTKRAFGNERFSFLLLEPGVMRRCGLHSRYTNRIDNVIH